jgi:hypothetical protein
MENRMYMGKNEDTEEYANFGVWKEGNTEDMVTEEGLGCMSLLRIDPREPLTLQEALSSNDAEAWKAAMKS